MTMRSGEFAVHQFEQSLLTLLALGGEHEVQMLRNVQLDITEWDDNFDQIADAIVDRLIAAIQANIYRNLSQSGEEQ